MTSDDGSGDDAGGAVFFSHEDQLIQHLIRTWSLPSCIGGPHDHPSWGDADCRDPAAVVVRLLVGSLHSYDLIGDCDSFGPGILALQASALRSFGPAHIPLFQQYSLDLQMLSEQTELYGWKHADDPASFVRKLCGSVGKMRTALGPVLLTRIPDRIRGQVEDAYTVSSALDVPTAMRNFAFASLRRGGDTSLTGGVTTATAPATTASIKDTRVGTCWEYTNKCPFELGVS